MLNDKFHGYGVLEYRNGDIYEGFFKDGLFSGKGTYYYNVRDSRIKYEGEWLNDKPNGYGVLEYKNGKIQKGNWKKGFYNYVWEYWIKFNYKMTYSI